MGIDNPGGGGSSGGGNAAAGATGSAVPSSADYLGFANPSGNLIGVSATNPLPITGSLTVAAGTSQTGTPTQVAGSATAVTILNANTNRKGFSVTNDSTVILYLILSATTPTSAVYSVKMAPQSYFEDRNPTVYQGQVQGIWASATGNAVITEFT